MKNVFDKDFGLILSKTFDYFTKEGYVLQNIYQDKECVGIKYVTFFRTKSVLFTLAPSTDILIRKGFGNNETSLKAILCNDETIYDYELFLERSLEYIKENNLI